MKNYERHHRSLAADAGERTVWVLPNPCEMTITKLVIAQTGGTPVAFTATIFNSKTVLAGSQSSGGDDPAGAYSPDPRLFRLCEPLPSDAPGYLERYYHEGNGLNFSNMDGGSSNKERKLYLEIVAPGGTADATWDVAIGGWTDVG